METPNVIVDKFDIPKCQPEVKTFENMAKARAKLYKKLKREMLKQ